MTKTKVMKLSGIRMAAISVLVLACGLMLLWQRHTLREINLENAALREQNRRLDELQTRRRERPELERFRQEAREVHGLRNRVAQLLRDKSEIEEELQRLRAMKGQVRDVQELINPKAVVETGEALDVAIVGGAGFFEVQMADGTSGYTRDGRFKVLADGMLITRDGLTLLSGFQPVPPGTTRVTIMANGEVALTGPGGNTSYRIQLFRFNNPAGLQVVGGNLLRETTPSGPPEAGNPNENGFGEIAQGHLEAAR